MSSHPIAVESGNTDQPGTNADPLDLCALGSHFEDCKGSTGRMFIVHCLIHDIRGFFAARVVTSLLIAACLIGLVSLVV